MGGLPVKTWGLQPARTPNHGLRWNRLLRGSRLREMRGHHARSLQPPDCVARRGRRDHLWHLRADDESRLDERLEGAAVVPRAPRSRAALARHRAAPEASLLNHWLSCASIAARSLTTSGGFCSS